MDGTIEENSEEVAEFSPTAPASAKFSELAAAGSAKVQTCLEFMSRDIKAVQAACTRAGPEHLGARTGVRRQGEVRAVRAVRRGAGHLGRPCATPPSHGQGL